MKRFHFPLESALRFRERQWEVEQAKLEALLGEAAGLERRRRENAGLADEADEGLRRARAVTGEDLAAAAAYRRYLDREEEQLRGQARECEGRIGEQRGRVIEARRRFRLIEKLRERRLADWSAGAAQELEMEAGELFLAQWTRDRAG